MNIYLFKPLCATLCILGNSLTGAKYASPDVTQLTGIQILYLMAILVLMTSDLFSSTAEVDHEPSDFQMASYS
jgi:hypothetical protein